jgi:hypothetical protein
VRASAILVLGLAAACSRSPKVIQPPAPPLTSAAPEPSAPVVALPTPTTSPRPPSEAPCDAGNVLLFASPQRPVKGQPLRVVAVFDHPALVELAVALSSKATPPPAPIVASHDRQGGPPYFLVAQVDAPAVGTYVATLTGEARCNATPQKRTIHVGAWAPAPPAVATTGLWKTRGSWTPSMENLYSAWVQHLFDAPLDAQPSWAALHDVLRDPARNLLWDHLGAGEDEQDVSVRPDCADLPYFLRAYFAFKLGLPFGWSTCSRGDKASPPLCRDWTTNEEETKDAARVRDKPPPKTGAKSDPAFRAFAEFLRSTLADATQSGAGRTRADDDESDYYPVSLSPETLRPGTVFADPYGHVLVVARRVAQTETAGGILLAVDGQPDGTVARKRFWRGNFLFAVDPVTGSPGWKRFRPFVRDAAGNKLRRKTHRELSDYSVEQYEGGADGFYDKMDDVLSPAPQEPALALQETLQALEEQVRTRVQSVDNGRKFLESGKPEAEMPDGAKLFETNGAWEDFSTPSRDLRLLIAIDVARAFPARVAQRPEHYAMQAGASVAKTKTDLDATLAHELGARRFDYTRSDGSKWTLSLEDVTRRAGDLEMAYNPNDCVEARWGAPAGSPEASTCTRHAPPAQLARMEQIRTWFHERKRPARD